MSTATSPVAALLERLSRQFDTSSEISLGLLRQLGELTSSRPTLSPAEIASLAEQYRRLGAVHPLRYELLRVLAATASADSLATFAQLVVADPPGDSQAATMAFVPLFQRLDWPVEELFPSLLEALGHSHVSAVLLDLTNFLVRQKRVAVHPAKPRVEQLATLLGQVVGLLGQIEERPQEFARSPQELTNKVTEALSLVVALCDALGLIGDPLVCGKLYQARELRHRRIRVEASAALARLGDPSGITTLVEMAAEPVVRTRALAYLEELNELSKVAPEHCTAAAQAVGLIAAWLAQPLRYGVGPIACEVVDQRRLYWPGSAEPQECFLVRYTMPMGEPPLTGIGLVGPTVTSAMHVDWSDFPPEVIYGYYAGEGVEHESIVELPVDKLSHDQLAAWTQVKPQLEQAGLSELRLIGWGRFFEYQHWIATATHEDRPVVIVFDGNRVAWYPLFERPRSPGPADWYAIHKGRVILDTFNPATRGN